MNILEKCFFNALLPISKLKYPDEMKDFNGDPVKCNSYWVNRNCHDSIVKQGNEMPKSLKEAVICMQRDELPVAHDFLKSCKKMSLNEKNFKEVSKVESEQLEGYNYPLY